MNYIIAIILITGIELLGHLLFYLLSRWNDTKIGSLTFKSILKGLIERAFIAFTLIINLPQALTFFAALKIATRIKDDDKISNEFYLLGNLLSVSMAIGYALIVDK